MTKKEKQLLALKLQAYFSAEFLDGNVTTFSYALSEVTWYSQEAMELDRIIQTIDKFFAQKRI